MQMVKRGMDNQVGIFITALYVGKEERKRPLNMYMLQLMDLLMATDQ